jgi:hypothetical protein
MSYPSCRPHCGPCVIMKVRVYLRDKVSGKFHGIGWICPLCLTFHSDIAEAERRNKMFPEKVVVPEPRYAFVLLQGERDEEDP